MDSNKTGSTEDLERPEKGEGGDSWKHLNAIRVSYCFQFRATRRPGLTGLKKRKDLKNALSESNGISRRREFLNNRPSWMNTKVGVDPWNRKRVRSRTRRFRFAGFFFYPQTRKGKSCPAFPGWTQTERNSFELKHFQITHVLANESRADWWLGNWEVKTSWIPFPLNAPKRIGRRRRRRAVHKDVLGLEKPIGVFLTIFIIFLFIAVLGCWAKLALSARERKRNPLQGCWRWMVAASLGWYGPFRMSCRALPFWEGLRKRLPKAEFIAAQAFQHAIVADF